MSIFGRERYIDGVRQDEQPMRAYCFSVTLVGYGRNPDQAWEDAQEQFSQDPGPTPETYDVGEEL